MSRPRRYEIVDTIAAGGIAVVYRARRPGLSRTTALKRLDLPTGDRTVLARFMRESRAAVTLDHTNIVSVFDCFEHDGAPHIAMEYLERGTLRPWIGRLSEVQVIGALEGILAGLAHAQELNLEHRDLKPENVLLTRAGSVKIADFGIAKAYANATGLAVGRRAYLAPEQVADEHVGPSTDLYALGVIAFELLSGRPPHPAHPPLDAAALAKLDPRLAGWVGRLLAPDPAKRPAGALEAREALAGLALELHGPRWRRQAAIDAPARPLDALPDDLAVPVRDLEGPLPPSAPASVGALTLHPPFLIHDADATLEVSATPDGAALRHVTRWRRPRARGRHPPGHAAPPPFTDHVDREGEIRSLRDSVAKAHAVNVYGNRGIGKTHVLVEALQSPRRAETIVLDGRGRSADDLLHALHDACHGAGTAVRDPWIARRLKTCAATVAIEDAELSVSELAQLLAGAPRCRFVLTSHERVLWDGPAIKVSGMAAESAPALAAQELGHELAADDHDAAMAIALSLFGHPLRLRQAFSRARESGAPLAALLGSLTAPPVLQDRLASLTDLEARVVRSLAPFGGAAIAGEHLRALVDEPELDAALDHLARRHDVAVEDGRYRLLGVFVDALPLADDLAEETGRAAAHFTRWLRGTQAASDEVPAIVALIDHAFREGRLAEALSLSLAAEAHLAVSQRWAAWGRVLAIALAAAHDLGDGATEGWAWNQLAVRSLGLGRTAEAQRLLERALDVRLAAGDARGAELTRANLRAVRRAPPPLPRLSHGTPLAAIGTIAMALTALAGAWATSPGGGDGSGEREGHAAVAAVAAAGTVALTVIGPGAVLTGDRFTCASASCLHAVKLNFSLSLSAIPRRGARFAGFSGAGCEGTNPCRITIGRRQRITARFVTRPHPVTTVGHAGRPARHGPLHPELVRSFS